MLLEGIIEYQFQQAAKPFVNIGQRYDFIMRSLNINVSTEQLTDKIRMVKSEYFNNT